MSWSARNVKRRPIVIPCPANHTRLPLSSLHLSSTRPSHIAKSDTILIACPANHTESHPVQFHKVKYSVFSYKNVQQSTTCIWPITQCLTEHHQKQCCLTYLVWNSYVSCCVETAWLYESFHRFRRSCIVLGEVAWLWRGCVRLWRGCVKMLGYSACLLGRGCVTPSLRFVGTAAYQIWIVGLVRTGKAWVRSACGIFWESFLAFPLISFALAVIIVSVNKAAVCLGWPNLC